MIYSTIEEAIQDNEELLLVGKTIKQLSHELINSEDYEGERKLKEDVNEIARLLNSTVRSSQRYNDWRFRTVDFKYCDEENCYCLVMSAYKNFIDAHIYIHGNGYITICDDASDLRVSVLQDMKKAFDEFDAQISE